MCHLLEERETSTCQLISTLQVQYVFLVCLWILFGLHEPLRNNFVCVFKWNLMCLIGILGHRG